MAWIAAIVYHGVMTYALIVDEETGEIDFTGQYTSMVAGYVLLTMLGTLGVVWGLQVPAPWASIFGSTLPVGVSAAVSAYVNSRGH
jgi:hypothetical protein